MNYSDRVISLARASSFVLVLLSLGAVTSRGQSPTIPSDEKLLGSYMSPGNYVVEKFKNHDVIFLGEMHSVRQNLQFLQSLIPELYRAGVYNLGYEFATYHDQGKIDELINASTYDDHAALELLWRCCDLKWVTQEYADTFRAVWELNKTLPAGVPRFRLIGLDVNNIDDLGNIVAGETTTNGLRDGDTLLNSFDARNFFWAEVIEKEVLEKRGKVLVYSGVGHSFTKFYNRRGEDNGISAGNLIFHAIGDHSFTIDIHGSANPGGSRVELAKRVETSSAPSPRSAGYEASIQFEPPSAVLEQMPKAISSANLNAQTFCFQRSATAMCI